ncbi:hypothetical protein QMP25_18695 [Enterocloster clostridioformis]
MVGLYQILHITFVLENCSHNILPHTANPGYTGSQPYLTQQVPLYVYNLTYEDYIELGKLTPSQEKLLREVMSDEFLRCFLNPDTEFAARTALFLSSCSFGSDTG